MSDDLSEKYNKIIQYLEKNNFNIYHSSSSSVNEFIPKVVWDNKKNWEEFFSLAKKEGISTVIVEKEIIEEDDFDESNEVIKNSNLPDELINDMNPILNKLKDNKNKIGSISFSWINNGAVYIFQEKTNWLQEFEKLLNEIAEEKKSLIRQRGYSYSDKDKDKEQAAQELLKKPPEEIADEIMEFVKQEFSEINRRNYYSAERVFWEEKNVNNFDAKTRLITEKVRLIADRKIRELESEQEKRKLEGEKKMLPELIEECVKWVNDNEMNKLTKMDLNGFLAEKEIDMSTNNKNILHTKVNIKLKSSR